MAHWDSNPIYFEGGETGILLLHGFTGSPDCMGYVAEAMAKAKFTVCAPLLAGHGTHYSHLENTHWQDWYQSAERAFLDLRSRCKKIMVAGLSMGGLLAIHLGHQYPKAVTALGLMATPVFLDGFLVRSVFPTIWKTPLRHLYRYQNKYILSINDPKARKRYQTYEKIPVKSVASLLDFQKIARAELKHIYQPTIVIHSLHDETVSYGNLDYIKAVVASDEVKTLSLKKSNHIITVDYEKDEVAKALIKFFKKYRK